MSKFIELSRKWESEEELVSHVREIKSLGEAKKMFDNESWVGSVRFRKLLARHLDLSLLPEGVFSRVFEDEVDLYRELTSNPTFTREDKNALLKRVLASSGNSRFQEVALLEDSRKMFQIVLDVLRDASYPKRRSVNEAAKALLDFPWLVRPEHIMLMSQRIMETSADPEPIISSISLPCVNEDVLLFIISKEDRVPNSLGQNVLRDIAGLRPEAKVEGKVFRELLRMGSIYSDVLWVMADHTPPPIREVVMGILVYDYPAEALQWLRSTEREKRAALTEAEWALFLSSYNREIRLEVQSMMAESAGGSRKVEMNSAKRTRSL